MKTIVVTGAAGFIASHLSRKLMDMGFFVVGVDNFLSGQERNIDWLKSFGNFNFVNKSVEELTSSDLPSSIWAMAHLASPASPSDFSKIPEEIISVNTYGTLNLLKLAQKFQARFLFASTSEIYGDPLVHPQPETYWGNVNPQGVRSVYDEAKRLGETYVSLFRRCYDLDSRIVRIFNTYGPRMRLNDGRVITNFVQAVLSGQPLKIYGDGNQTRSFCYVDDLVEGLTVLILKDDLVGQTVNLGNDVEISVNQLAAVFEEVLNRKLDKRLAPLPSADDPKRRRPDLAKARKLLNYWPKVSLKQGLAKTYQYFKELNYVDDK